jgi:hypothetical protein
MPTHAWRHAGAAAALLALASCNQQQLSVPSPQCPAPIATQPKDYGPTTPFPGRYSIRMALSVPYVRELVRSRAVMSDTGAYGTNLNTIWVDQRDTPNGRVPLLQIVFTVWRRTQEGTREEIPGRTYTLFLQLQPYMITRERVPDVGRRAEILCGDAPICPSTGAIVDVKYFSLIKGYPSSASQERVIDCTDVERYDFIDEVVLTETLALASRLEPIVIPTEGIVELIGDMLGQNVTLTDVGVAADRLGGLEIGFVMPQGSAPWSGDQVAMRSGQDWEFTVEPGLIISGVRKKIMDTLSTKQGLAVTDVSVALEEDGIAITCTGNIDLPTCPATPFTYQILVQPRMCRSNNVSIMRLCTSGPGGTPGGCEVLLGLLGNSVAVIHTTPVTDPCSRSELSFSAGDDVLHANRVETGGVFVVGGRSQKMNLAHPERTEVLSACPY